MSEADWVLVTAAASRVGLAAIQIANAFGAKEIATTRNPAVSKELSAGKLHAVIARTFPLSDIVEAHR